MLARSLEPEWSESVRGAATIRVANDHEFAGTEAGFLPPHGFLDRKTWKMERKGCGVRIRRQKVEEEVENVACVIAPVD